MIHVPGFEEGQMSSQFAVGLKLKGKTEHVFIEAEDALVAALKVKIEQLDAVITYVRRRNRAAAECLASFFSRHRLQGN